MSKDPDVKLIFTFDQKILLNSTLYDVDFPNQAFKSYAENKLQQICIHKLKQMIIHIQLLIQSLNTPRINKQLPRMKIFNNFFRQ